MQCLMFIQCSHYESNSQSGLMGYLRRCLVLWRLVALPRRLVEKRAALIFLLRRLRPPAIVQLEPQHLPRVVAGFGAAAAALEASNRLRLRSKLFAPRANADNAPR